MTVEALILVKPVPGKTSKVVSRIARGKTGDSNNYEYHDVAIKKVYLATGKYRIMVYVSTEKDLSEVFRLANEFANPAESSKDKRKLTSNAGGGTSSSSGGSSGTSGSDVSGTQVIILCPKPANDP